MKNLIFATMLFAIAYTAGAQGQQSRNRGQGANPRSKDPKEVANRLTKRMTKVLGLSQDVSNRVYEVNYSAAQKMMQLRAKYQGNKKAMQPERKKIKNERDTKLRGLLTADQYAKWKQIEKNRKKKKQQKNHHQTTPTQPPTQQQNQSNEGN